MKWLRSLALLSALALSAWLFREQLLNATFDFLVVSEPPVKADLAVVFAGDSQGNRILTAAQLERDGYVPAILVSGPNGSYDNHECDLAIPFSVKRGYPENYFRHFHGEYTNTADEATAIIAELSKENIKKVLIVTSAYHPRRTFSYFKNLNGIEAHMIAAPDRYANHGTWWLHREGRKTIFFEWSKTIATWLGV